MKTLIIAFAAISIAGPALAQGNDNSMNNAKSPGSTGAMKTPTAPGVATDPQGVAAQQGSSSKSSAGTVGAAPGAATQSQMPSDKSKQ